MEFQSTVNLDQYKSKGALNIEPYAVEKYKYQKEVLLKRNTKFLVNSIEYKENKYYFYMEVKLDG